MRPYYLLDTNIISEQFKKIPDKIVLEKVRALAPFSAISAVTWHELQQGFLRMPDSKRKHDLEEFLFGYVAETFDKIPYDEHAANIHAEFRTQLEQRGILKPYADSQIAAIAIANNMILVTRNTKDFEDIPRLMLENWFEGERK